MFFVSNLLHAALLRITTLTRFVMHPWFWHISLLEMDTLKVLLFQPTSNACEPGPIAKVKGDTNSYRYNHIWIYYRP